MKKIFIRIDIYNGIFSAKPIDTIYEIIEIEVRNEDNK